MSQSFSSMLVAKTSSSRASCIDKEATHSVAFPISSCLLLSTVLLMGGMFSSASIPLVWSKPIPVCCTAAAYLVLASQILLCLFPVGTLLIILQEEFMQGILSIAARPKVCNSLAV